MNRKYIQTMNRTVKVKKKQIFPGLVHLEFNSQKDLTSTLLRFQEYYESPRFRNKTFTVNEFINWYKTTRKGKFSYFSDWSGFNFPSYVLEVFKSKAMSPLTKREKAMIYKLKSDEKFYVIGTYKSKEGKLDLEVKKHEIAHALYYLDSSYRRQVQKILKKVNCNKIHKYIKKLGYHPEVFVDECHAYLLTDSDSLEKAGIDLSKFTKIQEKLEDNYSKYFKKHTAK